MGRIVEMDEDVTLKSQLEEDVGSVILLYKFTVKPEDVDQFLSYLQQQQKCSRSTWIYLRPVAPRVGGRGTFFIMLFGSLQNISNGPLIYRSSGQVWLTFFPIQ